MIGAGKGLHAPKAKSETHQQETKGVERIQIDLKGDNVKSGRNLGIVGLDSTGKSTFSLLWGYLNSRYKDRMGDDLALTKRALSIGSIPEVEKIIIIETQNKVKKALESKFTVESKIIQPLLNDGTTLELISVPCKRLIEIIKSGKVTAANLEEMQATADKFVAACDECSKLGPEYLWINDNMSDYYEMLDDKQSVLHYFMTKAENIGKPDEYRDKMTDAAGILQKMQQSAWVYRNKWWTDLLVNKKSFQGWNIDIFAKTRTPPHFLVDKDGRPRPGAKEFSIQWAPRTPEHIDHQFHINRTFNEVKKQDEFTFKMFGKYRNSVEELNEFSLLPKRKFAGLRMFEHIARSFLVEDADILD